MADVEDVLNEASKKGLTDIGVGIILENREAIEAKRKEIIGPKALELAEKSNQEFAAGNFKESGVIALQSVAETHKLAVESLMGPKPMELFWKGVDNLKNQKWKNAAETFFSLGKALHLRQTTIITDAGQELEKATLGASKATFEATIGVAKDAQTVGQIITGQYTKPQEKQPEITVNPGNGEVLGPPAPPPKAAPEQPKQKPGKHAKKPVEKPLKKPDSGIEHKNTGEKDEKPAIKHPDDVKPGDLKATGGEEAKTAPSQKNIPAKPTSNAKQP